MIRCPSSLYPRSCRFLRFPTPLHLTRSIEDPTSKSRTVIEEYCQGNRAIAIHEGPTSIADYNSRELTEIDRGRGTYSIKK